MKEEFLREYFDHVIEYPSEDILSSGLNGVYCKGIDIDYILEKFNNSKRCLQFSIYMNTFPKRMIETTKYQIHIDKYHDWLNENIGSFIRKALRENDVFNFKEFNRNLMFLLKEDEQYQVVCLDEYKEDCEYGEFTSKKTPLEILYDINKCVNKLVDNAYIESWGHLDKRLFKHGIIY